MLKRLLCAFLAIILSLSPLAYSTAEAEALSLHDSDELEYCNHPISQNSADIYRIYGSNRFDTAIKIADQLKQTMMVNKFDGVIIASGTNFADALSGSYLAAVKNIPILPIGNNNALNDKIVDYIKNNLSADGTIYILGGTSAVPVSIDVALRDFNVKRLAGKSRFETNLKILNEAGVGDNPILICTSTGFADSLSVSACKLPILLVNNTLTEEQKVFLDGAKGNDLYIIGGTAAVSKEIESQASKYGNVTRIGGRNRFETSVLIAKAFFDDPSAAVLTYAKNYPDGLCGGALAFSINAPLILTMDNSEAEAAKYVDETNISSGYVLGGKTLISDKTVRTIFNLEDDVDIVSPENADHTHLCEIVFIEPTCTEKGYYKHTCSICDDIYQTGYVDAVGHNWDEWEVTKEATIISAGMKTRSCERCDAVETEETPKAELESNIVAYYTVVDGAVVDIVSGNTMTGAVVNGDYFSGGTVNLPARYKKASIEIIMQYNKESTDNPIGSGFSYYGGALLFQEAVDPNNICSIRLPFGGGQIGTNYVLKPSINYDKPVLGDGDSYWCLAIDEDANNYALQINDDYVEKSHWCNFNKSFKLSLEHEFKEFIVYASRLSKEEMAEHFQKTGIKLVPDTTNVVGRVTDGITGLGSALAFSKAGTNGIPKWVETNTTQGNHSIYNENGSTLNYTISDFVDPDNGVDNSKYESVHIIKKPETLYIDYKYALSAVPYPFNVNHNGKSDQYDVEWESSDDSIAIVIDGLIVPQKTGEVTITATLNGTDISDSCTIKIMNKAGVKDKVLKISEHYISKNGHSFSRNDYVMTTNAIYDAIDEAYEDGYNHVVFPEIDFYAEPTGTTYYIPTGMTVEFPEGSTFNMMPSDLAMSDGYTFFQMGWGWWSCAIPTEKAEADFDENENLLAYYCRDAHLIIDKYYGEFYKKGATMEELYAEANKYAWGCTLLGIGKRAEYCTVEIREANCPAGFFITMGGKGNAELVNGNGGSVGANDFVSGWLDDSGNLVANSNWISTPDFFTVSPSAANGMDTLHEYYIGDWEHNVTTATQRLYDILWFDENYDLIQADRWQYVDEGYNKPSGAKYFKLSIQQTELPAGTNEYVRLCPDESSRFCEIKNTNIINGADGLASIVGATEACWIHNNYVSGDGLLSQSCWSLDLEDGWQGMRGTIIEKNIFKKYVYSGSIGDYRGKDTGVLALASGYNTFVISNYLGAIVQSNGNVVNTHIINNVIHTMFSSISSGASNDINPKIWAHVYNNIIGDSNIRENTSANGVVYHYENTTAQAVNKW